MRRWIAWALGIVVLVVAGYFAVAAVVVDRLLTGVLVVGRMGDIAAAGHKGDNPFDLAYAGTPRDAFGYGFTTVAIPTPLGPAPAWLIQPLTAKPVWAIFVHGIAGSREGGYRYLPAFRKAGLPTLMITYRNDAGAPKSPQGLYTFGLTEWPDLDAAAGFALEHGASGVIIAGDSMGGAVLGQFLAHSSRVDKVVGVIMDSPALAFEASASTIAARLRLPLPGPVSVLGTLLFDAQHGIDMTNADAIGAAAAYPGPMLLVHGSHDGLVPISVSERLLRQRFGATTFLRTHADHLQSRDENPALYHQVLAGFLSQF